MSLRKAREALSVLLAVIIVIGGNLFFGAQIAKYTLCNEKYLNDIVLSKSFEDECENNFKACTEALSAQSGIPAQVFQIVIENEQINKNPLQSLFNGNDDGGYSWDMTAKFKELCLEYFNGNNIEYDETMLKNTADSAAKAYDACFGLANMQGAASFIENVNSNYGKYTSIGVLLIAVAVFLLFILFRRKRDFAKALYPAFTALGASMIFSGLAGLIFDVGGSPKLAPELYANAVGRAVDGVFIIFVVLGVAITALFVFGSLCNYKIIGKS